MSGNPGAIRVYLIQSGVTSFTFALIFTITAIYRVREAGLNPLQLVLVGTALEVSYFIFNVPTGVIADTYSRRLSVILGVFAFSAGFLLEGALPVFGFILLAQSIDALGYALVEGALEAWITDEVGEENVGNVFLRGAQIGNAAGFAGIFASVGLASITLSLPILAGGVICIGLGVYLALRMPETGFRRANPDERVTVRGALHEMRGTVREGGRVVRHRPLALTILGIALIFGGFSEGFDRLWEAHFLMDIGLPALGALDDVVWFGVIGAGSTLIGLLATWTAGRGLKLDNPNVAVRALAGLNLLLIVGVILFALAGNFVLAVIAYWIASASRSLQYPVYNTWLNQNVDSRVRATVLSMSGQADALGQFTVGPMLGALGSIFSIRVALTVAGVALSPALLLYSRAIRKCSRPPAGLDPQPLPSEA